MYAGHLAAALALRARVPKAPFAALLIGVGWLDTVHALLVLAGVEQVRPDATRFLGWELVQMAWSHSFAAAVAWSLLAAAVFWRKSPEAAMAIAVAVFSHWALDFLVHEHDLAWAPGVTPALGLNLWGISPYLAWATETILVLAASVYYVYESGGSKRARLVVGVILLLHLQFLPPFNMLAKVGRAAAASDSR